MRGNYEEGARLEIFSIRVLVQYDFMCVKVYGQIVGSMIDTLFALLWLMAGADLL